LRLGLGQVSGFGNGVDQFGLVHSVQLLWRGFRMFDSEASGPLRGRTPVKFSIRTRQRLLTCEWCFYTSAPLPAQAEKPITTRVSGISHARVSA
jgi:hypothetical protein